MDMVGYPTRCQQIWRLKKRVGLCYGFIGVRLMTTGIFPTGRKTLGMGISNTYLRYLEITGEEHAITEWYDSGHRLVGVSDSTRGSFLGSPGEVCGREQQGTGERVVGLSLPIFFGWQEVHPLATWASPFFHNQSRWRSSAEMVNISENRHASNLYTIYTQSIHNLYTIYTQSMYKINMYYCITPQSFVSITSKYMGHHSPLQVGEGHGVFEDGRCECKGRLGIYV